MKNSKKYLGIELGSTRIKAVLLNVAFETLAVGAHTWENRFENGYWTYRYADIRAGLQDCYRALSQAYEKEYGEKLTRVDGMGISAMMHGYLPLDAEGNELTPFRTWRNTNTGAAARILSERFRFNIPLRWSIAHLYQALRDGESHTNEIASLSTLAGYVHRKLTGENVLGAGDASGMFPLAAGGTAYDTHKLREFESLTGFPLSPILPRILPAGACGGTLTPEGAAFLDPTGTLRPGIPFCPPEGDAGTGMVATNAVTARTGNISAGTSIFAMIVLEKALSRAYPEIDIVTTPDGKPVAMVHCNNGATDLDAWVRLFDEGARLLNTSGGTASLSRAYEILFTLALEGDPDGGGLTAVSYYSGEHNTGFSEGRPLLVRTPDARFTVANIMRTLLFSSVATLRLGMDTLMDKEHARIDTITGHGGLFTVKGAAQKLMAAALNVPVTVMDNAGEGGAWGIAVLAAFARQNRHNLDGFLEMIFKNKPGVTLTPGIDDIQGFTTYMKRFVPALEVTREAVRVL